MGGSLTAVVQGFCITSVAGGIDSNMVVVVSKVPPSCFGTTFLKCNLQGSVYTEQEYKIESPWPEVWIKVAWLNVCTQT